jgi:hypothetical protein
MLGGVVTLMAIMAAQGAVAAVVVVDRYPMNPQPDTMVLVAGGQAVTGLSSNGTALLYTSAAPAINLTPPGFAGAQAFATDGVQQVGQAIQTIGAGNHDHAYVWSGTAASGVDLHPTSLPLSYRSSWANGVGGGQQVGVGEYYDAFQGPRTHAMVWSGTAASAVDLNVGDPINESIAYATDGIQQVGQDFNGAALWSGSAASMVPLAATGLAHGVGHGQQVGYVTLTGATHNHAYLWQGTAASGMDLDPSGYDGSDASATNGLYQAGFANFGTSPHAMFWAGSAASAFDLHTVLGADYTTSIATGIDDANNVYGYAWNDTEKRTYVVVWSVPEPSQFLTLGAMFLGGWVLRRRPRSR